MAFPKGTASPSFTGTVSSNGPVKMDAHGITSGALSTTTFTSGSGSRVDTASDRVVSIKVNIVLVTDTLAIAISPDNTTYTTLFTVTPGVATTSDGYMVTVPAGWYVKVTVTGSATITANSVYY